MGSSLASFINSTTLERIQNRQKAKKARRQSMRNIKRSEAEKQDKFLSFVEKNWKVPDEQHAEQIRKAIESKMKNWENKSTLRVSIWKPSSQKASFGP